MRAFIASSSESLAIAYAVQENLEHDLECNVWTEGISQPSQTILESLLCQLDQSDFGIFILMPDDIVKIRSSELLAVRDNVIFELGLFIGRLGRERSFIIIPQNTDDFRLPTDLLGMVPLTFIPDRVTTNPLSALGAACNKIRRALKRSEASMTTESDLCSSQGETTNEALGTEQCISILRRWLATRPNHDNLQAIRFESVDRELSLPPGTARSHLEEAAQYWNYEIDHVDSDFIQLRERLNRPNP